jgi:PAS domain S-box-containing protein
LTNLTPLKDAAGRVVRIVGTSLCLDDQKRAEQQLRDQEERLRIALATGGMGTWDWHMQSGELHWSDAVYRLLGRPPHSFRPSYERFLACVDLRDRETVEQAVRDCANRRQEFRTEFRVVWPDGSEHWLSARGTYHYDEFGRPSRMVGVVIDATDRREREAALRQAKDEAEAANAAKDQFLAALSHELRTPLTPVLTTVTALEADPRLPAEFRDDMEVVRRNVELEARLIDDLLDLTRITKGKLPLFLDTVDVHAVLRHTIDICQSDIRGKRIAFTAELDAANPFVRADAARVQQIFWNLLKNAVKFTPERGTITLRTRDEADGRVALEVRDNGIGIEPTALPRLFRPFEQGGGGFSHRFGGLGLGLAIARALVEQHHGTISARSDGLGHGATFTVTLPLAERVPVPPCPQHDDRGAAPPSPEPVDGQRRPRILLVEDHADTARIMTRLLQKQGFDLATAGNVNDALALATSEKFDLLISDIGLPDGTGIDLMRQLRTLPYAPRAIALTGFGMEEDVRKTLEAGFERHLTKPVNFQQLQTIISQMATPLSSS